MTQPPDLPVVAGLNISAFSKLFSKKTASYKFVFFLALLDLLRRRHFSVAKPFTFDDLLVEMLSLAWYPHTYFKLSFGLQDALAEKIQRLDLSLASGGRLFDEDRGALRAALRRCNLTDAKSLLDRVPYRIVSWFVDPALPPGVRARGSDLEYATPPVVNAHFDDYRPLYCFDSDDYRRCSALLIHPDWAAYLGEHEDIVRGWAAWHWLQYMQKRNPATPGLANKLFPPERRNSLEDQSKYWRAILTQPAAVDLRCIYSGAPLTEQFNALDHYLPWSFVVHDQLWNLIPVPPAVNSAKSNRLPADHYFEPFIRLQHQGLSIAREALAPKAFIKATEPFIADLQIPNIDALLEYPVLEDAYRRHLPPLLTLARNQGFTQDWRYA